MKCPACENQLSPLTAGNVTVDACSDGCGGIWFDNFELKKLDEPHETEGHSLSNIPKKEGLIVDTSKKRHCPKCEGIIMMRHFFSAQRRVEVDECPNCAGVWLDAGELSLIREEHQIAHEQKLAADQERAHRFKNVARFIRPS